jgi:hypothetical protein
VGPAPTTALGTPAVGRAAIGARRRGLGCRHANRRWGARLLVSTVLVVFLTLAASPVAGAQASPPTYFFSDNSTPINSRNHLVMRPSGFALFLDGQWVLQHLRWTGWGSAVARATGISNSDTDIPNVASGRRIKTWADMTLSSPVRWRGHEVYSCFKILVPPPAGDLGGCVLPNPPIGNGWLDGGNGQVEFLAPGQNVWCGIDNLLAFCAGGPGDPTSWVAPSLSANLFPTGKVTLCSVPQASLSAQGGCAQNWDASPPVLEVGQEIRPNNVLCQSLRRGIVCRIASGGHTGKGFLINTKVVRRLG